MVKSYDETLKCDPIELADGSGSTKAVVFSNPNSSASITLVTAVTNPSVGGSFSYTGNSTLSVGTLYVESATKTLTNDGFSEVQISGIGTTNLGSAS